ncbi:MAG: hypothetical protein KJN93_04570 [Alphaproteobacteria bacterium]|nr:hypothetical protein [Alphaproteobacteria bacterium]
MQTPNETQVKRRLVFYIPGYDPKPPRRYRELYRTESARQAEISGYTIAQGRQGDAPYGWRVAAEIEGGKTLTDMHVLLWSDIVRSSMGAGIGATYLQLARTLWIYISTGALQRLAWLRKGPIIAALYPAVLLIAQALAGFAAGRILGNILEWAIAPMASFAAAILPAAISGLTLWPWLSWGAGWAVTIAVLILALRFFRSIDHRIFAYYLMHDYAFSARLKGATPPELATRLDEFAARIEAALGSNADEVLVIGHSSGAQLAVSILAKLRREGRVPEDGPALSLLTLGQVIPMISFLPKAGQLRRDLYDLSQDARITWVDVSAPGDGCSFALCDPVAVTGISPDGQRGPLVLSAAFSQTLTPQTFAKLKRRYFRLHFQYLCAFDNPGEYDYFRITAGPKTLAARFAGRAPSASRIDVAASRYRSLAA